MTIITPTGDRPQALAMLAQYIARQDWDGEAQWVVIDDGCQPTDPKVLNPAVHAGADVFYVRRQPGFTSLAGCSLPCQLIVGMEYIKHDRVLVMEDDDWYSSEYLRTYSGLLNHAPLVGESHARYYHVGKRGWLRPRNKAHASLAQTGFRGEGLDLLLHAAHHGNPVDMRLWRAAACDTVLMARVLTPALHVGIKGMPGRPNLGKLGRDGSYRPDPNLEVLRLWMGDDAERYAQFSLDSTEASG